MKKYALGIDTSNYKTSVAIVDSEGNIFYDDRVLLSVKAGELGLRQNEVVFQHIRNLPNLIEEALSYIEDGEIQVIAVSHKPREEQGSYMPCFMAGLSHARVLAASYSVPLYKCSHQDGHIEAGKRFTELRDASNFIAFHFSGGTTETLRMKEGEISIVGGTKDISFGQLLDRVGVAMGYGFPAGEEIDNGALRYGSGELIYDSGRKQEEMGGSKISLPKTKVDSPYINLSGVETAVLRLIEEEGAKGEFNRDELSHSLLMEVSRIIIEMMDRTVDTVKDTMGEGFRDFLFVGGVSSSSFLRDRLEYHGRKKGYGIHFASPELASDNAVGVAFLGGKSIWL